MVKKTALTACIIKSLQQLWLHNQQGTLKTKVSQFRLNFKENKSLYT